MLPRHRQFEKNQLNVNASVPFVPALIENSRNRLSEETARELASHFHFGQVDKLGEAYIGHLQRVVSRIPVDAHQARVVGWLHDVVEDTSCTFGLLASYGCVGETLDAIVAMTHLVHEPYREYLHRVRKSAIATMVKLADVADNSDPTRLDRLDPHTRARLLKKYEMANTILSR